jgi:hypothetical protein
MSFRNSFTEENGTGNKKRNKLTQSKDTSLSSSMRITNHMCITCNLPSTPERKRIRKGHPFIEIIRMSPMGFSQKKTQGSMSLLTYAKQLVKVIVLTKLAVY